MKPAACLIGSAPTGGDQSGLEGAGPPGGAVRRRLDHQHVLAWAILQAPVGMTDAEACETDLACLDSALRPALHSKPLTFADDLVLPTIMPGDDAIGREMAWSAAPTLRPQWVSQHSCLGFRREVGRSPCGPVIEAPAIS